METDHIDSHGLTQNGAKKLLAFITKNPHVRHRIAGEDVSHLRDFKGRVELFPDEIRQVVELPGDITSSAQVFECLRNVALDFDYYGSDVVGFNLRKIKLLARGIDVSSSPRFGI